MCFIAPGASRPLHYCSFFTGKKKSSPSIFRRTQGGRGASRGPRWCKRQRKRTRRSRARGLLLAWPCPRCAHVAPTWHPVDIPRIAISLLLLVRFQKFLRQQDPLDALSLHCPCPPERKKKKIERCQPGWQEQEQERSLLPSAGSPQRKVRSANRLHLLGSKQAQESTGIGLEPAGRGPTPKRPWEPAE